MGTTIDCRMPKVGSEKRTAAQRFGVTNIPAATTSKRLAFTPGIRLPHSVACSLAILPPIAATTWRRMSTCSPTSSPASFL